MNPFSFYFFFPILSALGFLASVHAPFLGSILYFFLFIPFILSFFLLSWRELLLSFIISLLLIFIMNKNMLIPYIFSLLAVCFPGILLLLLKKTFSHWRIIFYNSLWAVFLVTVSLLLLYHLKDFSLTTYFNQLLQNTIQETTNAYKKMGMGEAEIQRVTKAITTLLHYFRISFPAWMLISLTSLILTHYYLSIRVLFRFNKLKTDFPEFPRWKTPFFPVWLLIISLLLTWQGKVDTLLWTSGVNLLTLTAFLFTLQGLCNLSFFLQKNKTPKIFSFFIYLLFVIQPLLLSIIFFWGLFDAWFNFRKLPVG